MDSKILLENGTNELEILEFKLGNNSYGINVAKIREIITYQPVTPVPNSHPSVEGIFMPRDKMITAISLKNALQMFDEESSDRACKTGESGPCPPLLPSLLSSLTTSPLRICNREHLSEF